MICKRILPCPQLSGLIREYLVAQFTFKDLTTPPPLRAYPANPEEAIRFLIKGKLFTTNPATGITTQTPTISLIGQPTARQNLQISHDYLMIYVRFQPGSLFKLLQIPMAMLTDVHIDATAVMGKEIREVYEQVGSCDTYDAMINVLEQYFLKKLGSLTNNRHPVDGVGRMILQNPQGFELETTAEQSKTLAYDWYGSFGKGMPSDSVATIAEGTFTVPKGHYTLHVTSDDGVRVWLDGKKVIDHWKPHEPEYDSVSLALNGTHQVRIEHLRSELLPRLCLA